MTSQAWIDGQPIHKRLPEVGYQDNPVVLMMDTWADEELVSIGTMCAQFYREMDPLICKESSLDYLAALVGYSDSYWDPTWIPAIKRLLIFHSHYLWSNKGTEQVIRKILEIHGMEYDLWMDGILLLPFNMPGTFGGRGMRLFLRLPLLYPRLYPVWQEAVRTLDNYCPSVIKSRVCYYKFYLGFSVIGDPMF